MEKKHKLQISSGKRNKRNPQKNSGVMSIFLKSEEQNCFSNSAAKRFVQIGLAEYKTNARRETKEYIVLLETLGGTKYEKKYGKRMNTSIVPYEVPQIYSLQNDIEKLAIMKKKMNILKKRMCMRDMEAIASDWKNVGGDINETINARRKIYAGKYE